MLPSEDVRRIEATRKAARNARARDRRRRGLTRVLSWERQRWRRCTGCGRWIAEAQTAGWTARFARRWCEACAVAADLRRAA